jgi:hypothetical protein
MRKKGFVLRTISLGLLLGLIVPGLGGLIFPSMLIETVGPFITSQNEKIILEKYDYSYKPGQSGTQYNFYIVDENGEKSEVTIKLIVYSFFIYSAAFILLLFTIVILYRKFLKKTA